MRAGGAGAARGEAKLAEWSAPECVFSVLVEVAFAPGLSPLEMVAMSARVWERLSERVDERHFSDLRVRGRILVSVDESTGRGRQAPLFPLRIGWRSYADHVGIAEALQHRCRGLLSPLAHDLAGRAYRVFAEPEYSRRPGADTMPPPRGILWRM